VGRKGNSQLIFVGFTKKDVEVRGTRDTGGGDNVPVLLLMLHSNHLVSITNTNA